MLLIAFVIIIIIAAVTRDKDWLTAGLKMVAVVLACIAAIGLGIFTLYLVFS